MKDKVRLVCVTLPGEGGEGAGGRREGMGVGAEPQHNWSVDPCPRGLQPPGREGKAGQSSAGRWVCPRRARLLYGLRPGGGGWRHG